MKMLPKTRFKLFVNIPKNNYISRLLKNYVSAEKFNYLKPHKNVGS